MRVFFVFIFTFLFSCFALANTCDDYLLTGNELLERQMNQQALLNTSSGVQIEGKLVAKQVDEKGNVTYFNTEGKTALKYSDDVLEGQGHIQHPHGFSSPVGRLEQMSGKAVEDLTASELEELGIIVGKNVRLKYSSGVEVVGDLTGMTKRDGKNIIFTFENATVKNGKGDILFEPDWGTYDMTIVDRFVSPRNYRSQLLSNPLSFKAQGTKKIFPQDITLMRDFVESTGVNPNLIKFSDNSLDLDFSKVDLAGLTDDQVEILYQFQRKISTLEGDAKLLKETLNEMTSDIRFAKSTLGSRANLVPDDFDDFVEVNNYKKANGEAKKGWEKIDLSGSMFESPGGKRVSYRGENGVVVLESYDANNKLLQAEIIVMRDSSKPQKGVSFFAYEFKNGKAKLSRESNIFSANNTKRVDVGSTNGCVVCHKKSIGGNKTFTTITPSLSPSAIHPSIASKPHQSEAILNKYIKEAID